METTDQQRYAEAFDALPYALDIETKSGLVGIVHAECAGNSWTEFCAALEAPGSNTKLRHTTEVALWARSRMQAHEMGFPVAPIAGLAYLVVGHTPVLTANRLANIAYIDTGAVFGRSLTVLPLDALSTLPMMQATRIDTRTNMDMLVGNEP
jgi:serine/threonine protein phosphatase 1